MSSTATAIARSLVAMLVTLVVASIAIFLLLALMPGDPATRIASRAEVRPSEEAIEATRKELGLDRPIVVQYLDWISGVLRGDLSRSWISHAPVRDLLFDRIGQSLLLGITIFLASTAATAIIGGIAGSRPNGIVDRASRLLVTFGTAIPSFVLSLIAIRVISVWLGWAPVIGDGTVRTLPLPAAVGAVGLTAFWVRPFRSLISDALSADWAFACRARGATSRYLLFAHALPNALIGFMPFLGLGLAGVLAGAFLIENVFAWPGVGPLVVESIKRRDLPVVQGFALITVTLYVVSTHLTDALSRLFDPNRRPAAEEWA